MSYGSSSLADVPRRIDPRAVLQRVTRALTGSKALTTAGRNTAAALLRNERVRSLLAKRWPSGQDGREVDPATAAMLALSNITGGTGLAGISARAARRRTEQQVALAEAPAPAGVSAEDLG